MKGLNWLVAGLLALASTAIADVTYPLSSNMSGNSIGMLLESLDDSVDELRGDTIPQATSSRTNFSDEVRGRFVIFEERLDDLREETAKGAMVTPKFEDVEEMVQAYYAVLQGLGFARNPEMLEGELADAQRSLDQIVAAYGGYERFDLPSYVEVGSRILDENDHRVEAEAHGTDTKVSVIEPEYE